MTVVDASAMTELILQTETGERVAARLRREQGELHAPHLLDVEVLGALRRFERTGGVPVERAEAAFTHFGLLRIVRHDHGDFLQRAWDLRRNYSAYDAVYLALAEDLRSPVVTCDARLERAPGLSARIELIR